MICGLVGILKVNGHSHKDYGHDHEETAQDYQYEAEKIDSDN